MTKRTHGVEDQLRSMIHEVEAVAKDLRAGIRKRAKEVGLTKKLQLAAKELREGAAKAAAQVERYAHTLRTELEGNAKPAARRKQARR